MKKYVLLFLVIQLMTFTQSSLASNIPSADTSATELAQGSQEKQTEPTEENNQIKPADALQVISVSKVFWSIVLILIGFLIIKIVIKIMEVIAERSTKLRITIKSLIPIIRIIIWILISFIIIRGIYNPPIETLVAMTASVAIALGLAAQDLLKNVFGGIMLLFDRPFQVGDKIETSNHYGEVIQIGLRATRIVTPDDSTVSIPNMELMNTAVSNSNTGELNCQVVAEIYLPIDIDTHLVRKIATEAAQVSKYIYLNKPIVVLFFNEIHQRRSYLKMRLKAYVMDIRYEFQFKSDMTEIVIKELLKQKLISRNELL